MTIRKLKYCPVDSSNWNDLELLFESKGGPHYCWCVVWRNMKKEKNQTSKAEKKALLKSYVNDNIPIGLLCYFNAAPIAWCSIAPRETYRDLSGDRSLRNVWSLVCFFIKREYRRKGMTERLITEALKYAKNNGAKYVEAYPIEPDSKSYRFMGYKSSFDKMGFDFRHKAGKRRNVMIFEL